MARWFFREKEAIMLNELYRLSEALQRAGIIPFDWHDNFSEIPNSNNKKPCYKISLGTNAEVSDITPVSSDLAGYLRKYEPNNGHSFPAFNIYPIYRITGPDRKKLLKKWREGKEPIDREQLQAWCKDEVSLNWDDKITAKLKWCLYKIPQELAPILGDIPHAYLAVRNLLDKCAAYIIDSELSVTLFRKALEARLWRKLDNGEQVALLLPFLVYEGNSDKAPDKDRGTLSVCLDVTEWTEYPVVHKRTMVWINECLMKQQNTATVATISDAYAQDSAGYDEKLPEVKLPVLGGVKLRAMYKGWPCQYRYGTIEAASFRVGQESRRRMKGALEWLGNPEREGLTWGRVDGKELLFAYPYIIPPTPLKIAGCLGANKTNDRTARFEEYAREVITGLRGLAKPMKEIELQIFSLRKMDKARTKVVFHRNYTAQRMADAAAEWQDGCYNIPNIIWHVWGEEKGKWIESQPDAPFPLQISGCLNQVWKLDGSTNKAVSAISLTVGIELLLDEQASIRLIPHLLTVTLQNGKGLLLAMGNLMHKSEVITTKNEIDRQKQWLPAIVGLLLYKLGIRKENYMNNAPYLVGNMFKVSDDLHALYCKEVRSNKMPPQLLGNALMVAALESPEQALAQLALRIVPYLGWAKTNNTESAGLSRHFLKGFSEIEAKLKEQTLPQRLNNADRAQLLLGYLAK
jgi:hypothetical protein